MTYTDAKKYLHIAENAYDLGAYSEAAEIAENVARAVAFDKDMPGFEHDDIVKGVKSLMARFQFCPDECLWEDMSSLSDLFHND